MIDMGPALQSPQFTAVRRRIFRQLIESLIYEGIVTPRSSSLSDGLETFMLTGHDAAGNSVHYTCKGRRTASFDRIRLTSDPVQRVCDGVAAEATSLSAFLLETRSLISTAPEKLSAFMEELNQTLLKDALAQHHRHQQPPIHSLEYDELEAEVMDGHPYHPCYKSRIGFDPEDQKAFGPEFKPRLMLVWLAVRREEARVAAAPWLDAQSLIEQELGAETFAHFASIVVGKERRIEEYVLIPVHPWQWREVVATGFMEQLSTDRIILLGEGPDEYRPQQSIRTLANATAPRKAYVKLPLSIANTSTGRILAQHTILNAAAVSDWLGRMVESDVYLRDELKLVLLREVLGVSYHHQGLPDLLEARVYGTLGAIWRESLHTCLHPGEEAVPFNALCHVNTEGRPLIDPWIAARGVEGWTRALLRTAILPLIRLLYTHGVGLEAHAQNVILIHRAGEPVRLALKDFHDGVRFTRSHLRAGDPGPAIQGPPANHPRINRNSFLEREDPAEVKDFFHDAFFFINLGELAWFLDERYDLPESRFWELAAEVIHSYHRQFPGEAGRSTTFDLFSEYIAVEQLTGRRLFAEAGPGVHQVRNPLFAFRRGCQ